MLSIHETIQLEPEERIIALFRRHGATVFVSSVPYALLIILLFLFIFPLFSLGGRGIALFAALGFLFAMLALRKIAAWLGTITILTSRRLLIIQRFGFFKKKVNEIKLDQISELSYEVKGMLQTAGTYGTIFLLVTFTSAMVSIPDIPDPQSALNAISQAIGRAGNEKSSHLQTPSARQKPSFHAVSHSDPANWK
ncbi:hypothetical protein HY732_01435 [Candidatus Uhrbacteria bacterium]|nr:hypothetical protein [Candidatus Uhrbacteria bacterium]